MGRGEKSLLSDPGSELRLGRKKEQEQCEDNSRDKQTNKQMIMPQVETIKISETIQKKKARLRDDARLLE